MNNLCYVCKSNHIEQVSLTLPNNSHFSNLVICQDCGYARRCGDIEFEENIKIQQKVFGKEIQTSKSKPKWPDRRKLVASAVERLAGKMERF